MSSVAFLNSCFVSGSIPGPRGFMKGVMDVGERESYGAIKFGRGMGNTMYGNRQASTQTGVDSDQIVLRWAYF